MNLFIYNYIQGGEIKSRKKMKKEQAKEEGNESQNNFAKLMNMYSDDA